jgi:type I restriction enzyme, S subunit
MTKGLRVRIADVAEVFDGPHATPRKTESGPLFLGITCLEQGRLNLAAAEHLSIDDYATWTRRIEPRAGDVVFSYETKIGAAALIPKGLRCCLGRRMALVRPRDDRLDPRYFLYQYLGPEFQALLASRTIHGSTVDRIALKDFPNFTISLPPIDVQRGVAEALGAIDDKIELNQSMSQTLEAIAQAIFKCWFVDFDPTLAKGQGDSSESICRRFGLLEDELIRFPDRLQLTDAGMAPEGWHTQPIGRLIDIVGGSTPNTKETSYWIDGVYDWATPKDLSALDTPALLGTERRISEAGLAQIGSGLLPKDTVLLSSRAPIGRARARASRWCALPPS